MAHYNFEQLPQLKIDSLIDNCGEQQLVILVLMYDPKQPAQPWRYAYYTGQDSLPSYDRDDAVMYRDYIEADIAFGKVVDNIQYALYDTSLTN